MTARTSNRPGASPSGSRRPVDWSVAFLAGLAFLSLTAVAAVAIRVDVRHAAPFGSVQTVDFDRGLAVLGGEVTPNYPDFSRIDLDLRAYGDRIPDDRFDFVLSVRSVTDRRVVRRVAFSVDSTRIDADRSAFAPLSATVRFAPIVDSAGTTYQVLVERGPRNGDDVVTLWGIRTYSALRPVDLLGWASNEYGVMVPGRNPTPTPSASAGPSASDDPGGAALDEASTLEQAKPGTAVEVGGGGVIRTLFAACAVAAAALVGTTVALATSRLGEHRAGRHRA